MPYDRNADLPSGVKVLPAAAQTIWRKAFNAAVDEYDNEETAYKVAWAAVKTKYKKNADGDWVRKESEGKADVNRDNSIAAAIGGGVLDALKRLGIVRGDASSFDVGVLTAFSADLDDGASVVEFLKVGTFIDSNGREVTVTSEDLDEIAANFENKVSEHDVPIDIEHEYSEAAGWVKRIWRDGSKLLAEVEWTKLGRELVGEKIYRYLSASFNDITKVLTAISLVNFPAVTGLEPLALASPKSDIPIMLETSMYARLQAVERAWAEIMSGMDAEWGWIADVYDDSVVVALERGGGQMTVYYRIPYEVDDEGTVTFPAEADDWEKVSQGWIAASAPMGRLSGNVTGYSEDKLAAALTRPIPPKAVHVDNGGNTMAKDQTNDQEPKAEGVDGVLDTLAQKGVLDQDSLTQLRDQIQAEFNAATTQLYEQLKQEQSRRLQEMVRAGKTEAELTEFSRKVTSTGQNALPMEPEKLHALLGRMSADDRKELMTLLKAIHDNGLVDFREYGTAGAPEHAHSKKLDEAMTVILRDHIADGGNIAQFFKVNADLLGHKDDYDLSVFEDQE